MVHSQYLNIFIRCIQQLRDCIICCIFQLIYLISFSTRFRSFAIACLKYELFQIKGACKQTGHCCKKVMLYDQGIPVNSLDKWLLFQRQTKERLPFRPNVLESSIASYDCRWLTNENKCLNYKNRPSMCQNYPHSFFLKNGFILPECGYYIQENRCIKSFLLPSIKEQVYRFTG